MDEFFCRKKEEVCLEAYEPQNMKRKNRCFITQTHIWKWSWNAFFSAENLTCIGSNQSKTMKLKQLFVCDKMTKKKKFPFLVIWSKTNICFCMMIKKGNFFFLVILPKTNIWFYHVTKKGNFFFLGLLSKSNICFWQKWTKKRNSLF